MKEERSNKIKLSIRHSFSFRLSIYILFATAIIYLGSAFMISYYSHNYLKKEALNNATTNLNNSILEIESILGKVEAVVDDVASFVGMSNSEKDMTFLAKHLIEKNDIIVSCKIALEPNAVLGSDYYMIFSKDADDVAEIEIRKQGVDYKYAEWYLIPKLSEDSYWSDPYFDREGVKEEVCTYSVPIYKDGNFIGVVAAGLTTEWIDERVNSNPPYPNAHSIMLGKNGSYIVHPNRGATRSETVFTYQEDVEDTGSFEQIVQRMVNGESDQVEMVLFGIKQYVFFAPIPSSGWSVILLCQYSDIFEGVSELMKILIFISALGLIFLFVFSMTVIRDQTKPLLTFAEGVREVGEGNFDVALPEIDTEDEMKEMRDSFVYMQKSLNSYVQELEKTTSERERISSELQIAQNIQMDMVPKVFPPFPGRKDIDVYATLQSAKEVGGDLYDYFIDNNKYHFIIGDISGKGVPASLFMAITRSLFRAVAANNAMPSETVSFLNNAISEANDSEMFVTLFVGILDLATGVLRFCNAGHNPPVLIERNGSIGYMKVNSNIPVGLFDDFNYEGEEIQLEDDSYIVLFTDGLTEAENPNHELYSETRLLDTLRTVSKDKMDVKEITDILIKSVDDHAKEADQSDDITILTINWKKDVRN